MTAFLLPPALINAEGEVRRAGFELEFSGLDVASSAEATAAAVGGSPYAKSPASWRVDSPLGTFKIELDWRFLHKLAGNNPQSKRADHLLESLSQAASLVVPVEVICPPLAMNNLAPLNNLTNALRRAGAKGTEESPIAAYGTHINPELPALDSATIVRYLKAFALLQWWLVEQHHINTTRKLSPYIDLYSESYLHRVLTYNTPSQEQLIDDYLHANHSRNRALDLLPLFAYLDEKRVRAEMGDEKINPRPTLHYRLPNCQIDDPNWSLAQEWQHYCTLERLANRPKALAELANDFRAADRPVLGVSRPAWVEHVDLWRNENLA